MKWALKRLYSDVLMDYWLQQLPTNSVCKRKSSQQLCFVFHTSSVHWLFLLWCIYLTIKHKCVFITVYTQATISGIINISILIKKACAKGHSDYFQLSPGHIVLQNWTENKLIKNKKTFFSYFSVRLI